MWSIVVLYLFTIIGALPIPTGDGAMSQAYSKLNFESVKGDMGSWSDFLTYTKGNTPIRGVNLGGWLVLEPWMNTDLFSETNFPSGKIPEDEFNFVDTLGYSKAGQLLEEHYLLWITEQDFETMSSYGLNAVRIPIGYWAWKLMATDKYYQGSQAAYLDKAIGWARTHNLKVWIDLHGVPGSQNGYDSSGHKYFHDWNGWNNMDETKEVLSYIFAKYGGTSYKDVVIGIELVNEPLVGGDGISMDTLSSFYSSTIQSVRNSIGSNQNIIVHDGYQQQGAWTGQSFNLDDHLVYDTHLYVLFDSFISKMSFEEKVSQVCSWGNTISGLPYKVVVGEMTLAWDTDSNSIFSQKISQWSSTDKDQISRFTQAQFNAYEKNYGWFYWNWKMGDSDQWDFQKLVQHGVIPNPVSERTHFDCT